MALLPIAKTIFRSLFQKPATLKYPFAPMPKDPLVRGQISIDIDSCTFCTICAIKCPTHAITVERKEKSWEISRFHCIVCNACTEVCPKKCLHMVNELTPSSGGKTKDKSVPSAAAAVPAPAATTAAAAPAPVPTADA